MTIKEAYQRYLDRLDLLAMVRQQALDLGLHQLAADAEAILDRGIEDLERVVPGSMASISARLRRTALH